MVDVYHVSADPEGDTVEAVQPWLERQRVPGNFHYLIGSRKELKPVWDAYFAAPQSDTHAERGDHSASIWLIDAEGRIRTKYSAGAPVAPDDVAHDFLVLLREADRASADPNREGRGYGAARSPQLRPPSSDTRTVPSLSAT